MQKLLTFSSKNISIYTIFNDQSLSDLLIKISLVLNNWTQTFNWSIAKTYLYNFDPLKPHFYIVKLGLTGVYFNFLISAQKHRLDYSLQPPHRDGSNEYPQSMF